MASSDYFQSLFTTELCVSEKTHFANLMSLMMGKIMVTWYVLELEMSLKIVFMLENIGLKHIFVNCYLW